MKFRLVDSRGRKYLTAEECAHFLQVADQTFALTLAHTSFRISKIRALRAPNVNLDAGTVRIRTLKRRTEHWREVPVPPDLLRAIELAHWLRSLGSRCAAKPLPSRLIRFLCAATLEAQDFLTRT